MARPLSPLQPSLESLCKFLVQSDGWKARRGGENGRAAAWEIEKLHPHRTGAGAELAAWPFQSSGQGCGKLLRPPPHLLRLHWKFRSTFCGNFHWLIFSLSPPCSSKTWLAIKLS